MPMTGTAHGMLSRMKLSQTSVEWALDFISARSDSDLFPPTPELQAIQPLRQQLLDALTTPDLQSLTLGPYRRFLVPKDEVSYRQATQLDPQDALILTALIHEYGDGIEKRRASRKQVFSYRFEPNKDGGLYEEVSGWNDFWVQVYKRSFQRGLAVYCDIADFYNQIYHHTLENQLIESGFPNQATKWIMGLCESTTAGVSRGVPIGPHGVHLLAEATLIPIDNALNDHGLEFLRYADDIVIFVNDENSARSALATVAHTLDKQQRLMLQRHKSKIYTPTQVQQLALQMIEDQPVSEDEADLLRIVKKYSHDNPYYTVWFGEVSDEDWLSITQNTLERIVDRYFATPNVNYPRLSWFYRRLAQIGHPGALAVTLQRLSSLIPCLPSVITYISSIQTIEPAVWASVGAELTELIQSEVIHDQEYYEVQLLSLFARNRDMNHFSRIGQRYSASTPAGRRQILLAARENDAIDWLRELKEDFPSMDSGQRLAFLYAMIKFPSDERKHFVGRHQAGLTRQLELVLAKVAKT
jgi:hypothetical protein